jgi:ABC-type glutathione transport system ATPase component
MADPILEIRGLRLAIRTDEGIARVLDHIDRTLERGRILGLVGESGCGKSTVIRAIIGILPAGARTEAGTIRFDGEDLLELGEDELNTRIRGSRISFIPQDPYLALNPFSRSAPNCSRSCGGTRPTAAPGGAETSGIATASSHCSGGCSWPTPRQP